MAEEKDTVLNRIEGALKAQKSVRDNDQARWYHLLGIAPSFTSGPRKGVAKELRNLPGPGSEYMKQTEDGSDPASIEASRRWHQLVRKQAHLRMKLFHPDRLKQQGLSEADVQRLLPEATEQTQRVGSALSVFLSTPHPRMTYERIGKMPSSARQSKEWHPRRTDDVPSDVLHIWKTLVETFHEAFQANSKEKVHELLEDDDGYSPLLAKIQATSGLGLCALEEGDYKIVEPEALVVAVKGAVNTYSEELQRQSQEQFAYLCDRYKYPEEWLPDNMKVQLTPELIQRFDELLQSERSFFVGADADDDIVMDDDSDEYDDADDDGGINQLSQAIKSLDISSMTAEELELALAVGNTSIPPDAVQSHEGQLEAAIKFMNGYGVIIKVVRGKYTSYKVSRDDSYKVWAKTNYEKKTFPSTSKCPYPDWNGLSSIEKQNHKFGLIKWYLQLPSMSNREPAFMKVQITKQDGNNSVTEDWWINKTQAAEMQGRRQLYPIGIKRSNNPQWVQIQVKLTRQQQIEAQLEQYRTDSVHPMTLEPLNEDEREANPHLFPTKAQKQLRLVHNGKQILLLGPPKSVHRPALKAGEEGPSRED